MTDKTIKLTAMLLGCLALAACNSNNNGTAGGGGGAGGGGTGGGGSGSMAASDAAHNAAFAAASAQGATTTMPTSLSGTFDGGIQAQFGSVAGDPTGYAVGDLSLQANWTEGQAGPAFTGTASNFAGEVDGAATTWNGQLTADSTAAFNSIQVFDGATICGAIPAGQPCPVDPASRTSAVTVQMNGSLQADGGTAGADSSLLLNGFVTNDNAGITGAVASGGFGGGGLIMPDGSIATVAGAESTFYATK